MPMRGRHRQLVITEDRSCAGEVSQAGTWACTILGASRAGKRGLPMALFRKLEIDLPAPLVDRTSESFSHYEKLIYFGQISSRLQQTTNSAQQFVYFAGLITAATASTAR